MCGIIGIYNHPEAATLAYLGLYAQQHRGQESAGIATGNGDKMKIHLSMGQVPDIFSQGVLNTLKGIHAIGHVRYSTQGESHIRNCQPFMVNFSSGSMAVVHNGNIVNALSLRKKFEDSGAIFQSNIDTEVVMHLLARSKQQTIRERITDALSALDGAFSLLFLTKDTMIAARDSSGFRPLVLGKKNGAHIVASETSAFDLIGAEFVREIEPGEVVFFSGDQIESFRFADNNHKKNHCIFEYVYFARPDSHVFNRDVYEIRKGFGHQLAKESATRADLVVPVPDSGVPAAIGYSHESKIPFEMGLVRNHYVGRTFIEPEQNIRHFGVKVKLNPVRKTFEGKKVILVDDSIVRGTTSKKIVKMIRDAGAKEIHLKISSPPTKWPCFYGMDTPSRRELISAKKTVEETRLHIECDSLQYLSVESLYWFDKINNKEWFCDACFTGKYPVGRAEVEKKIRFETGEAIKPL
ncbi:MAG: amidophosphoribosyltransferase [Deltaproteobacteria bacterium]|nr:amidophosphoribosyltransferase [Deltaproteobacteria bacterium]